MKVSQNSCWLILQDNKIFFKGTSTEFHFPNDESSTNFKFFKLWADTSDEEKIVDLAVGDGFTLFLTDKAKIWAVGDKLLK